MANDPWTVVDLSGGIPGAYATRILCDAGADVLKIETPGGDPLRSWAAGGVGVHDDGALFKFLAGGKRSFAFDRTRPEHLGAVRDLIAGSAVTLWSWDSPLADLAEFRPAEIRRWAPATTVVAITPFGLTGPWANVPATELTLQAWSGGAGRGVPAEAPRSMGGYVGEWLGGMFAGLSALISRYRRHQGVSGELIDVSLLESLVLCQWNHEVTYYELAGRPWHPRRAINIPDIEPTKDGHVGIMVVTSQMWEDFCLMIEHPEWLEDQSLYNYAGRLARGPELTAAIREWAGTRTTEEIVDLAGLFRLPVAPVGTGATIPEFEQFRERGMYQRHPGDAFLQPTPPYRLDGHLPREARPAPALGEHTDTLSGGAPRAQNDQNLTGPAEPPLQGLRVVDFTGFWAGPIAAQVLAVFGAEVVHVESVQRPDGFRGHTVLTGTDDLWWEWTPAFHASNTNKLGVTLDMGSPEGRDLARRLIAQADVVVDNYSPRVMDNWGLTYNSLSADNPGLIMLRMPAFGLTGPWRDRTGFAQTMEQMSGMSCLSGYADGEPTTLNGPCDPISGIHAAIALMVALEQRHLTGRGMLVESIMVAAALNVAAELVISQTAYGVAPTRSGNLGYRPEFQNLYPCADLDSAGDRRWVAIAATNEHELAGLYRVLGRTLDRSDVPAVLSVAKSGPLVEELHADVTEWCAVLSSDHIVELLQGEGVPVGKVLAPHEVGSVRPLEHRQFYEVINHPVVGRERIAGFPAKFSRGPQRNHRTPAPTLGQHNAAVLQGWLGLSEAELGDLESAGVIGTRLAGTFRRR